MNSLTNALLGGTALCALAVAPALAGNPHPAFKVTALHAEKIVNKTKMRDQRAGHITYTFSAYSTVSLKVGQTVDLVGSFFKWNSYSTICSNPKQKIKFNPKKTPYGKLSRVTETYSLGCPSGTTMFYGAAYKLLNPTNEDHFVVTDIGVFKNSNGKYKGTLNLDMTLAIE